MGFLEPTVDESKCINCGMCEKACHLIENTGLSLRKPNLFAAAAKNKNEAQRYASSSGGMFYLLADSVLQANGSVYGAAFDKDFVVFHTRISSESEISDLLRSKYVQSDTKHTFSEVEKDLKQGKTVLYSGVPCQVAAIQSYLAAKLCDCSNLRTVEVVCHGCPSPLAWKEYLSYAHNNICKEISKVFFRHKIEGWHARIKVRFLGLYSEEADFNLQDKNALIADDSFIRLFLENLTLRDECHRCDYARRERVADITLCDFWGIENTQAKTLDDNKGTSGIIIHSEKGMKLWTEISKDCDFMEVPYGIIAQNQQTMNVPYSRPENKDAFWSDFLENGWDCVKNYIGENEISKEGAKMTKTEKETQKKSLLQKLCTLFPQSRRKAEQDNEEYMALLTDCQQRLIHIEDKVNSMKDYLIAMRSLDK